MVFTEKQQKSLDAFDEIVKERPYGDPMCLMVGGSTLYGLNTDDSDLDLRGVYMLNDINQILGLPIYGRMSYENYVINTDEVDAALYDIRKYLHLLTKTNSQVIELLYAEDDDFIILSPLFRKLRENKTKLIDTDKAFNSLRGFIQGERRLMNGERTGKLGGKRKDALEKYGYSYKNLVQILRLAECGKCLYKNGYFPVNLTEYENGEFREVLMSIKTNPEKFDLRTAEEFVYYADKQLVDAYENRNFNYKFDEEFVMDFLTGCYGKKVITLVLEGLKE